MVGIQDIEHATVIDDPRAWSKTRKLVVLATVSAATMINGLGTSIYNRTRRSLRPASISQIEDQLHASSGEISLSLSLFIVLLGGVPLLWSTLSEFWGRKKIYLLSTLLALVGCIVAANAKTIGVLIGMRCIQAVGSAAVTSLGAATLADIYEPVQRGTMMGIYYSAPLLGPALGPILGGALTAAFSWRATFWFLAAFTGVCFLSFIPLRDTFRCERSLTCQAALRRRRALSPTVVASSLSHVSAVSPVTPAPPPSAIGSGAPSAKGEVTDIVAVPARDRDVENHQNVTCTTSYPPTPPMDDVKLSLADVNPAKPILLVLRRMNNLTTHVASGLIYGLGYSLSYTCSRTLAEKYGYNALQIGLVLLTFGVGSLMGSILGGRYSDRVLRKLVAKNGGERNAEMRLASTLVSMPFLPLSVVAYGWVCEQHVHVAAICVFLFLSGLFSIAIYSSTLAYVVDANAGRSASAVAVNSFFRGFTAFVATEVALPLQVRAVFAQLAVSVPLMMVRTNAIGDGGLYSLWAGLIVLSEALLLLVWWKGGAWRQKWELKESS
ncbi:MFS general substrate transporter [Epithele typhae]|uniref:MFS general substrate transporter n=1 Tax=Epithele typhae TaxID=378194 RepID=UPI002007F861|nr:MFS general substrate transporter [Epithele typhae]KAH9912334.1 MFS general substrate transporter [Epithele typhae]